MNVGWLKHYLRDIPPDVEIMVFIPETQIKEGDTYADLAVVDCIDVEKHKQLYLKAEDW